MFKNFGPTSTGGRIRVAKKNLDLSDAVFRQRVIDTISRVQQALLGSGLRHPG